MLVRSATFMVASYCVAGMGLWIATAAVLHVTVMHKLKNRRYS